MKSLHSSTGSANRLYGIALLMVVALLLAACAPAAPADETAGEPTEGAASGDDAVTIDLWHHWSTSRHPLLQETVASFMEEHPNIEVVETLQPQDGILEKLLTAIAGGDPPDVAMLHRRNLLSFASEGALVPLDDYVEANDISPDYWYAGEYDSNIYDGNVYGLPLTEGATFMNYNLDLFEQAGLTTEEFPATWDEFLATAQQLTQMDDNNQVEIAGYSIGEDLGENFMIWLVTNGQPSIYSDDGRTAHVNTEAGVETIAFLQQLVDETMGGYQNVLSFNSASSGLDQPPFASGLSAMETGQAWQFLVFSESAPDLNYGLAPFPAGPNGDEPLTVNQASWSYVIPRGIENQDAAWELLEYLTVGAGAEEFLKAQNRASPVKQYAESEFYTENVPKWEEFLEVTDNRKTVGISAVHPQVEQALNEMMERVLTGDMTPEEGAEWGNAEVQSLLDDFWATR